MATPAVIARLTGDGGWHGTHVTYDGVPDNIGKLLLDLFVDEGGDLEAAWTRITAPEHGWSSFMQTPRESPRWDSGGTGAHVVDHDNHDYAMDTAVYYLIDLARRQVTVRTPDEELMVITVGPRGIATVSPPAPSPTDWRNRRQDYGSAPPQGTARALVGLIRDGLPSGGPTVSISLIEPQGMLASVGRRIGTGASAVRVEDAGVFADLRLITWTLCADDGSRTVSSVADAHKVIVPRRCLGGRERALAFVRGWLDGLRAPDDVESTPHLTVALYRFLPAHLLDLDLTPDELERATREATRDGLFG